MSELVRRLWMGVVWLAVGVTGCVVLAWYLMRCMLYRDGGDE